MQQTLTYTGSASRKHAGVCMLHSAVHLMPAYFKEWQQHHHLCVALTAPTAPYMRLCMLIAAVGVVPLHAVVAQQALHHR